MSLLISAMMVRVLRSLTPGIVVKIAIAVRKGST
jgi:hypothetical protein